MILLLATLATAAVPNGTLAVRGALDVDSHPEHAGVSAEVGLELALSPRWQLLGTADLGVCRVPAPRAQFSAGVRLFARVPEQHRVGLSVLARAGVVRGSEGRGVGELGVAVHRRSGLVGRGGPIRWRVQGTGLVDGLEPAALTLSVGLEWTLAPPPEPVVVAEPVPPPPPAPDQVVPPPLPPVEVEEPLVWLPQPVCEWRPLDESDAFLDSLQPGDEVQVAAPGFVPEVVEVGQTGEVQLQRAPVQGSLVVLGFPGDIVDVDGHRITAGGDGVVVLNAPVGPARVEVVGGGQREQFEVAISEGYAIWLRSLPPVAGEVRFGPGSAELTAESAYAIALWARDSGEWGYRLVGSYSPEGTAKANQRLARARARAVADAMINSGVPRSRVDVAGVLDPVSGMDPSRQRRVLIEPIAVGGAR